MQDREYARHSYDSLRRTSAPRLLAERARRTPDAVAYRAKRLGIYRERSWADYRDQVAACAFGFRALGLEPGNRVAIMGDACEEWAVSDLAAQSVGAVTYGIYPTASASEVRYQMEHGGASLFVAENQEYIDKILPLLDTLPDLRWVVAIDAAALFDYAHAKLVRYDDVLRRGREAGAGADAFDALIADLRSEAPAFIVYTSGTTGNPKGALISHGKHLAAAFNMIQQFPILGARCHRTVAFLPLSHIIGRNFTITLPLVSDIVPHYGEDIENLPQTLFEVAPTCLQMVPRYLQKFASQILVAMDNSTPLKKLVHRMALAVGRDYARKRWQRAASPFETLVYRLFHFIAFRPVLNKIGFDRLVIVTSGGAALSAETMAFWQVYGVNVAELYGQTETAGAIISGQPESFPRPGDVGTVPVGWEVKLGADGEILVKGEDIFDGYWQDPVATRSVVDADGWLHTGDVGEWRDGRLRVVDRARDFMVTSGGKTISPTFIENVLRASPYISEAIVFADNRKYVGALIEIDYDTLSDWARANNVGYAGFTSLTRQDKVMALLRSEIDKANQQLARVEQVKTFRILPKALDPEEEGEPVTPTRKIKRKLMYETFKDLVESMYEHDEEARLAAAVGSALP